MEYFMNNIDFIAVIVNIILSFLSFILALFSAIFVIITLLQNGKLLKQNNALIALNAKTLDESTRPFVAIYIEAITVCEQTSYFVLKNFGHSPALITDFVYNPVLKSTDQISSLLQCQFDSIKNIVLSPGQRKLLQYDVSKLPVDTLTFQITYCYNEKVYTETTTLNVKNYIHLPVSRPETHIPEGNERQVHLLRELLEHSI